MAIGACRNVGTATLTASRPSSSIMSSQRAKAWGNVVLLLQLGKKLRFHAGDGDKLDAGNVAVRLEVLLAGPTDAHNSHLEGCGRGLLLNAHVVPVLSGGVSRFGLKGLAFDGTGRHAGHDALLAEEHQDNERDGDDHRRGADGAEGLVELAGAAEERDSHRDGA